MEIRSLALTLNPCEHGVSIDFTLQIALLAASLREELVSVSCGEFESPSRKLLLLLPDMSAPTSLSPCKVIVQWRLAIFTFKVTEVSVN
jgi:hypothetical protein